ncbi:hypothetical protein INR49_003222, partial [Caranx melampygus]
PLQQSWHSYTATQHFLKHRAQSNVAVILTVYLNDTQQMLTEVPVTPATRVVDVVEYCKEAGEGECHLAEVWNGHVGGQEAGGQLLPQTLSLLDTSFHSNVEITETEMETVAKRAQETPSMADLRGGTALLKLRLCKAENKWEMSTERV